MAGSDGDFRSSRHTREVKVADWRDAEELACWHMVHALGISDARVTAQGVDGGLDVTSERAVAQVKHHGGAVGAPDVQQLRGAAHGVPHALFYSLSGFTPAARVAADGSYVALFTYTVYGDVSPLNRHADDIAGAAGAANADQASELRRARGDFETKLAALRARIEADPDTSDLPPRVEEQRLWRELEALLEGEVDLVHGQQEFVLRAYDYYASGRVGDIRWYQAAGGPPGIPEMYDASINASLELEEQFYHEATTRLDLLEMVQMAEEKARSITLPWRLIFAALPEDKRGYIVADER